MNIDIRYSNHIDLVFHAMAYMHVNNASDCYDQNYIDMLQIEKDKEGFDFDISSHIRALEPYYNENFSRTMLICFLPFYSGIFEELKKIYLSSGFFTNEDRERFVILFISILENEAAFYFDYWQRSFDKLSAERQDIEKFLVHELSKYSRIFEYYKKSALAYLSLSITKNGRGFSLIDSCFSALVQFPKNRSCYIDSFFQLLHEYTHQFTDALLERNINMRDGSHSISENLVILADYYFIKQLDSTAIDKYFYWISGFYEPIANESEFLEYFQVESELDNALKRLISEILSTE